MVAGAGAGKAGLRAELLLGCQSMDRLSSTCALIVIALCCVACGQDRRCRLNFCDGQPSEFTPPTPGPGDADDQPGAQPPVAASGGASGAGPTPGGQA